ncbi:monoacylglycerol lipase ABHD6-like [Eublepharis macularius]|uniref:acylglycerol lipase n=1 Tax=Eublepharis macularius TaxID=481883 RepID=A0AA97J9S1_EUBMA|nr:monoacylglycerol lipase ABHD6-like [Eublepharis macularius]
MELTAVKIIFMILGSILACLTSILISRYHLWHKIFFKILTWLKRIKRHMKVKYIKHNGYNFCYLTRGTPGSQPSMLMLHGFSLNKDMWLETLKYIPREIHVICLDLPGHGATTRLLGDNYAAAEQAKRIHEFVKCIGLDKKPFHLIGFSVGGMIAGVYAALYPSEVRCLSLLCPGGVQYESGYEFIKHFRELEKNISVENSRLISLTERQGEELLKLGLYHPSISQLQLLKGYLDDDRPQRMFFIKNFLDLTSEESRYSLQENASKIRAPTEIIWGKYDKVLEASGADILAKLIPNCHVYILDKCGHFITIDRPQKSAELILEFHNSVCDTKKNN